MNVIAKHLEDIANEHRESTTTPTIRSVSKMTREHDPLNPMADLPPPHPPPTAIYNIPGEEVAASFTKKQLLKRPDWSDWEVAQFKQLDQYWNQGMFSNPLPLPKNSNALRMLWRFNLKACGTKKSRMVCNGS
ncbi:MAG: hypothetical protein ACK53Y_05210, partial [bacterium]